MDGSSKFTCFIFLILLGICQSNKVLVKNNVIDLNEDNWTLILEGEWMVEFFAPWCPACKSLQPIWKDFSSWSEDLNIRVGQIDITSSPGLSGRFMVTALPTIFHVYNGEFRQYRGTREKVGFISYIEEGKWKQTDPIPGWKSPNTIQMSAVSSFFKLSQTLRNFHATLMEEYGVPQYGSYMLFAIATILAGAILGLILVCLIDFIYPPKPAEYTRQKPVEKEDSSEEELSKEDLLDEDAAEKNSGSDTDDESQQEDDNSEDNATGDAKPKQNVDEVKSSPKSPKKSNKNSTNNSPTNSPNVRKRVARKAD